MHTRYDRSNAHLLVGAGVLAGTTLSPPLAAATVGGSDTPAWGIALLLFVVAFALWFVLGIVRGVRRTRPTGLAAAPRDAHAFLSAELGLTMADGGEAVEPAPDDHGAEPPASADPGPEAD